MKVTYTIPRDVGLPAQNGVECRVSLITTFFSNEVCCVIWGGWSIRTTSHNRVGVRSVRQQIHLAGHEAIVPFIVTSWNQEYEIKSFCFDATITVPAGPHVYNVFAGDDTDLNRSLPTATDSYSTSLPPEAGENFCGEFLYRFIESYPLSLSSYTGSFALHVQSYDDIGTHTRKVEVKLRYYQGYAST